VLSLHCMGTKAWAAFNVIDRPGQKGRIWSRVGSAWVNGDGSITLVLDSFPVGGRIQLREEDGDAGRARSGALALGLDAAPREGR
jgi:hypothetical protein